MSVSVSSYSDDGRLFQALGSAQENERDPNLDAYAAVHTVDCWWNADEEVRSRRLIR